MLSAKHVMSTPCVVREIDTPEHALREMKNSGVSTAYVVGRHMKFLGIVGIDAAIRARKSEIPLSEVYERDVETTTEDTYISEILPIAAEAKYPIAVVDDSYCLLGIVTKASVLSSLM